MPWGSSVPVFRKQIEEEATHWKFLFRSVCTSQLSSTLSLKLPFCTYRVMKGREKKADYIFVHQRCCFSLLYNPPKKTSNFCTPNWRGLEYADCIPRPPCWRVKPSKKVYWGWDDVGNEACLFMAIASRSSSSTCWGTIYGPNTYFKESTGWLEFELTTMRRCGEWSVPLYGHRS